MTDFTPADPGTSESGGLYPNGVTVMPRFSVRRLVIAVAAVVVVAVGTGLAFAHGHE